MCCLVLAACSDTADGGDGSETDSESTVLAVGDSFFDYNALQQASIPDVLGKTIGITVINAATSGAYFANPDPAAAADGLDVRSQHQDGDWEWVVVTGGGNDRLDRCGC